MVSDSSRSADPPEGKRDSREARKARLAEALRVNLKRRKIQARGRGGAKPLESCSGSGKGKSGS